MCLRHCAVGKVYILTCVYNIVQLVKLCDSLSIPVAAGVVHMAMSCGCNGLIKEVMNEIGQNDVGEADSRNISTFLENIAILQPNLIIPILDEIMDYLSNDVRLPLFFFFLSFLCQYFFSTTSLNNNLVEKVWLKTFVVLRNEELCDRSSGRCCAKSTDQRGSHGGAERATRRLSEQLGGTHSGL